MTSLTSALFVCSASGPLIAEPLPPQPIREFFFLLVTKTTGDVSALPVGGAERKMVMEARRRGLAITWQQEEDGRCLRDMVLRGERHLGNTPEHRTCWRNKGKK